MREVSEKEGKKDELDIWRKGIASSMWPRGIRAWMAAGAIILTYLLWAFVLVMIKSQGRHNCGRAFPSSAFPLLLLTLFLTFLLFFLTLKERGRPFLSGAVLIGYTFGFLVFFLSISIVAMCWCSDPATISKTYLATSLVFAGDIAIKGAMFNGLM